MIRLPARKELIATIPFAASGVVTQDVKIDGLIDRFLLFLRGSYVADTGAFIEASNLISSVELLLDGQTLKKVDGRYLAQFPSLVQGMYPRDPVMSAATVVLDNLMVMHVKDPYCRGQLDVGLHTAHYKNKQLRVTFNTATALASGGTGVAAGCTLDILGVYKQVPPFALPAFQELAFDATALASGTNDIKIPVSGGLLRRLVLFAGTPANIAGMSLIFDNMEYPLNSMRFDELQKYNGYLAGSGGGTSEALSHRWSSYVANGVTGPWNMIDLAQDASIKDLPDLSRFSDITLRITAIGTSTLRVYTGIYLPYSNLGNGLVVPPLANSPVQAISASTSLRGAGNIAARTR